jgi:hypothetical protein
VFDRRTLYEEASVVGKPVLDDRNQHAGRTAMAKRQNLVAVLVVVSVALLGAVPSARAADEWFVLGQQAIKSTDTGAEIKSQGNRRQKDVKQVKLSVEGADVQIEKVVLKWDNRPDEIITDIGVLKSGGQTAPKDAPGRKGRLNAVAVQYKVLGDAPTANLKVWGYD